MMEVFAMEIHKNSKTIKNLYFTFKQKSSESYSDRMILIL